MVAYVLRHLASPEEALEVYRSALPLYGSLAEQDSANARWPNRSAMTHMNISALLDEVGRSEEAAQEALACLEFLDSTQVDPSNWSLRLSNAQLRAQGGSVLVGLGHTERGEAVMVAGVAELEGVAREDPDARHVEVHLAHARRLLAETREAQGRTDEALATYILARDSLRALDGKQALRAVDLEHLSALERRIAALGGEPR